METKKAYLIKDITEYGKFISYCIHNDITVCRAYWDERERLEIVATPLSRKREDVVLPRDISMKLLAMR